jgi:hypothetical protein
MKQIIGLYGLLCITNRMIYFLTIMSFFSVVLKNYNYSYFIINLAATLIVYLLENDITDKLLEDPIKTEIENFIKDKTDDYDTN